MAKTKKKNKKYQIQLSFFSIFLSAVFLLFILAWIFVLGILVGRGFLPGAIYTISDLEGQVKKLQEIISRKEPYSKREHKKPDTTPELAFYEKLASKKDEAINNSKPDKKEKVPQKQEVQPPKKDPAPLKKEAASPEKEVTANRSDDKKREDAIQEVRRELSPLADKGKFTVQLASLGELDKAESMIQWLVSQGYDAYYYEARVSGKSYYRIRCGKFENKKDAAAYALKLKQEAGLKGFVSRID